MPTIPIHELKFEEIGAGKLIKDCNFALMQITKYSQDRLEPWSFNLKVTIVPDKDDSTLCQIQHKVSVKIPDEVSNAFIHVIDGKLVVMPAEKATVSTVGILP